MREKLTEEERIQRRKESNHKSFAKYKQSGNANQFRVVLTKDDSEKMQSILDSFSLSFPQFIRKIISGEIVVDWSDDKKI